MTALAVFCLAFVAEFLSDALSVFYQTAVRKMWRRQAVKWGALLALLSWIDLSGVAMGWPLWALIGGSITGGMAGTWYSIGQNMVNARLKKARRRADLAAVEEQRRQLELEQGE
jgi:hypothetical protein